MVAEVKYIYSRAYGPICERGSGIPISPPEPENAEIQSVRIAGSGHNKKIVIDIWHLLTTAQHDAIVNYILEART